MAVLTAPAGALVDTLLVLLDTVALLGLNCAWRPFFDNVRSSEGRYTPAIFGHAAGGLLVVGPLVTVPVHTISICKTWDYYADLFGNRTEWRLRDLVEGKQYAEALDFVANGRGMPMLEKPAETGIWFAALGNGWATFTGNTREAWRKQWRERLEPLAQAEVESLMEAQKTASTPSEWDEAKAHLLRLGVNVEGNADAWRAMAVWREAFRKEDYKILEDLLIKYPSVQFDGLPMAYSEVVQRPRPFQRMLYEHRKVLPLTAEEMRLAWATKDTHILNPTVSLEWLLGAERFQIPKSIALEALEGEETDLVRFLKDSEGFLFGFSPFEDIDFPALKASIREGRVEILQESVLRGLLSNDMSLALQLAKAGHLEMAQALLPDLRDPGARRFHAIRDPNDTDGSLWLQISPPLSFSKEDLSSFLLAEDEPTKCRIEELVAAGWIRRETFEQMRTEARRRCFLEEFKQAKADAEQFASQVGKIETEDAARKYFRIQTEGELAALRHFPEFRQLFLANRSTDDVIAYSFCGDDAVAFEILAGLPKTTTIGTDTLKQAMRFASPKVFLALAPLCHDLNGPAGTETLLMRATQAGNETAFQWLLEHGANVHRAYGEIGFGGKVLTSFASAMAQADLLSDNPQERMKAKRILVFSLCAGSGLRALDLAILENRPTFVEKLLSHGAETERALPLETPLLNACFLGHVECAMALLKGGAKVNVYSDYDGDGALETALLTAIRHTDSQALVTALMNRGAPVSWEAVEAARAKDWVELSKKLAKKYKRYGLRERTLIECDLWAQGVGMEVHRALKKRNN